MPARGPKFFNVFRTAVVICGSLVSAWDALCSKLVQRLAAPTLSRRSRASTAVALPRGMLLAQRPRQRRGTERPASSAAWAAGLLLPRARRLRPQRERWLSAVPFVVPSRPGSLGHRALQRPVEQQGASQRGMLTGIVEKRTITVSEVRLA